MPESIQKMEPHIVNAVSILTFADHSVELMPAAALWILGIYSVFCLPFAIQRVGLSCRYVMTF